ncbi:hypothetical protein EJ110_NYTH30043 [Nymphaea thermarum]|nr:hypothetical protein EJ110_NYTH30043 [Nymphaea thermarum]
MKYSGSLVVLIDPMIKAFCLDHVQFTVSFTCIYIYMQKTQHRRCGWIDSSWLEGILRSQILNRDSNLFTATMHNNQAQGEQLTVDVNLNPNDGICTQDPSVVIIENPGGARHSTSTNVAVNRPNFTQTFLVQGNPRSITVSVQNMGTMRPFPHLPVATFSLNTVRRQGGVISLDYARGGAIRNAGQGGVAQPPPPVPQQPPPPGPQQPQPPVLQQPPPPGPQQPPPPGPQYNNRARRGSAPLHGGVSQQRGSGAQSSNGATSYWGYSSPWQGGVSQQRRPGAQFSGRATSYRGYSSPLQGGVPQQQRLSGAQSKSRATSHSRTLQGGVQQALSSSPATSYTGSSYTSGSGTPSQGVVKQLKPSHAQSTRHVGGPGKGTSAAPSSSDGADKSGGTRGAGKGTAALPSLSGGAGKSGGTRVRVRQSKLNGRCA